MKVLCALMFLGFLLLNAVPAVAQTDTELELFAKKVERSYALQPLQVFSKPARGLCVCINDPNNFWNVGAAGILSVYTFIRPVGPGSPPTPPGRAYVTCTVMMAEANGDITQGAACPEWVPLAK